MFTIPLKLKQYMRLLKSNPWIMIPNSKSMNYLKFKFSKKGSHIDSSGHGVVYLTLEVTKRCNLSCSFCINAKSRQTHGIMNYEMTSEQCRKILNYPVYANAMYVMLSGGEPLLNRDIFNIIKTLKQQRRIVALATNGVLLDKHLDKLLDARVDSMNISIYPENIAVLKQIIPYAATKVPIKLCKVVTKSMLRDPAHLFDVAELAASSNSTGLYLSGVLPGPGAIHSLQDELIYDDDPDYASFKEHMASHFPNLSVSYFQPLKRRPASVDCQMPWYLGIVDSNGNVAFCCYDLICNKGNIFDDPSHELYNSEPWTSVRSDILSGKASSDTFCRNCFLSSKNYADTI